jgi:hypothetical protein
MKNIPQTFQEQFLDELLTEAWFTKQDNLDLLKQDLRPLVQERITSSVYSRLTPQQQEKVTDLLENNKIQELNHYLEEKNTKLLRKNYGNIRRFWRWIFRKHGVLIFNYIIIKIMNNLEKKFPKSRNRKTRSANRAQRAMYLWLLAWALTMTSCRNTASESERLAKELYKANKELRKAEENLRKEETDLENAQMRLQKAKSLKESAERKYNKQ